MKNKEPPTFQGILLNENALRWILGVFSGM
jgi:hypothetical protein